jgi:hypothetical protein
MMAVKMVLRLLVEADLTMGAVDHSHDDLLLRDN